MSNFGRKHQSHLPAMLYKIREDYLVVPYLGQGSPNYDPRARCGPRSHVIRPTKPFC